MEKEVSVLPFSEHILSLRAAASALYDRGFMQNKKPEDLQKEIEPLQAAMKKLIERASRNDLPGCVMAVQRLESQARAHEKDAKFLQEKADNARHHAVNVKNAVITEMKKDGVTERHVGDFTFVITKQDGREVLILR